MLTAVMILAIVYWKPMAMWCGAWLILGIGFNIMRSIAKDDRN